MLQHKIRDTQLERDQVLQNLGEGRREQAQGTSYKGLLPLLPSEEQGRVRDFIEKFYAACKDSLVVFGVSCRWVFVGVLRKFLLGMPAPRTGVCVFLAWLRSPFQ